MKIAKGTIYWIVLPLILGIFFICLSYFDFNRIITGLLFFIGVILLVLTLFFLIFFRDPDRSFGDGVVAVADGVIREITNVENFTKISTFMNIYNVHVNRTPLDGIVKNIVHKTGSYLPAYKKESERNERVIITVDTEIGVVKIVQIAGMLARRIVPYVKKGDKLKKGERIGIIRLGSRVDLYLPSEKIKKLYVENKDIVRAGENTVAELKN